MSPPDRTRAKASAFSSSSFLRFPKNPTSCLLRSETVSPSLLLLYEKRKETPVGVPFAALVETDERLLAEAFSGSAYWLPRTRFRPDTRLDRGGRDVECHGGRYGGSVRRKEGGRHAPVAWRVARSPGSGVGPCLLYTS